MDNAQRLKILSLTGRTVFSFKNLKDLWQSSSQTTKVIAKRMVDKNLITRISRGYFALDENFNEFELANIIITPSYVSFNSSLFHHGISFQVSMIISSVALLHYQRKINEKTYKYFSMKESLFFNLEGINYKDHFAIAKPERAILDCLYFGLLPNIDVHDKLNFNYIEKISSFYPKSVQKKLKKIRDKR